MCSLLLFWGFGLLLFSSFLPPFFFILNKLHSHSSHHTNYTEKKRLRNIQAQFTQTNLRNTRGTIRNLNTIKVNWDQKKYQSIRLKDNNLSLTYCDDVCGEEMETVSILEHEFFSLCQIPCYRFWRCQSHFRLSTQPSNCACSKSNKVFQRYL